MIPEELQPEFLLRAYAAGVFPMADETGEISWYSPDPRAIIELDDMAISRSLKLRIKRGGYTIRINTRFDEVVSRCADRGAGTWISPQIIDAYRRLRYLGYAHSVEVHCGDDLAGGLYGVSLGGAFFGESMFSSRTDGSKLALVALVERLSKRGMLLLDVQFLTDHLARFGAVEIPRREYLQRLRRALELDVSFVD